jgi:hypothetical protein
MRECGFRPLIVRGAELMRLEMMDRVRDAGRKAGGK